MTYFRFSQNNIWLILQQSSSKWGGEEQDDFVWKYVNFKKWPAICLTGYWNAGRNVTKCGITSSFLYTQKKPKEISFVIRPTLHNLKCHFNAESKRIKTNKQTKSTQNPQEPKESGEQFKLNQGFLLK